MQIWSYSKRLNVHAHQGNVSVLTVGISVVLIINDELATDYGVTYQLNCSRSL
jgi:hypothetical protein